MLTPPTRKQFNNGDFSVSPLSQSAAPGVASGPYVIMLDAIQSADQAFHISDGASGGAFSPGSTVTIASGSSTTSFTYANPLPGAYALVIAPGSGPYSGDTPAMATIVITSTAGSGAAGQGGTMSAGIIDRAGAVFNKGFLFATQNNPDDLPFAVLQGLTFKDQLGLKELMGPEQLTALAVGASEQKIVMEADYAIIKLEQFLLARGGSINALDAVAAPIAAPTLAASGGSTSFTAGYIAVACSFVTPYGQTLISPIQAVQVTAGQQITVTSIGSLPSGATSVNYFMTGQSYASSAAAIAATLLFALNGSGAAQALSAYPAANAQGIPAASSISTARRVYTKGVLDEPSPTRLHFMTPQSGSDMEIIAYGVVIPDVSIDFKMREFVIPKFTCNIYGDVTQPGGPIFNVLMS